MFEKKKLIENVNESVEKEMLICSLFSLSGSRKCKCGNYEWFLFEIKVKIVCYVINYGVLKVVRYYLMMLNKNV